MNNEKPINPKLAMFGIRMDTGRPILERVDANRCSKCSGFGTYGNPLCGAVYYCSQCNGSGYNPPLMVRVQKLYERKKTVICFGLCFTLLVFLVLFYGTL
jgi:hypothetical protein